MTDGGGYDLAVSGPKVDAQVSLDDPQTTFFRDPATRRAVTDIFALRTEVGASSNYAKFAYVSPALFGLQLALSFTPTQGKEACPSCMKARMCPAARADMWEGGIRYSDDLGPGDAVGLWRLRRRPRRAQAAGTGRRQRSGLRASRPIIR